MLLNRGSFQNYLSLIGVSQTISNFVTNIRLLLLLENSGEIEHSIPGKLYTPLVSHK